MKNTHTPAPWAKVYGAIMKDGKTICEFREHTSEADQDLIASAPELLSALEDSLEMLGELIRISINNERADEIDAICIKASAAIAKARGEA